MKFENQHIDEIEARMAEIRNEIIINVETILNLEYAIGEYKMEVEELRSENDQLKHELELLERSRVDGEDEECSVFTYLPEHILTGYNPPRGRVTGLHIIYHNSEPWQIQFFATGTESWYNSQETSSVPVEYKGFVRKDDGSTIREGIEHINNKCLDISDFNVSDFCPILPNGITLKNYNSKFIPEKVPVCRVMFNHKGLPYRIKWTTVAKSILDDFEDDINLDVRYIGFENRRYNESTKINKNLFK